MVMSVTTENRPVETDSSQCDVITAPVEGIILLEGESPQSDVITLSIETVILPQNTPIPQSGGLALKHALPAQVELTRDSFVISSGGVDEEGYGHTYQEAYTDFLTSLRDRYRSLSRREARLSSRDHAILEELRALL